MDCKNCKTSLSKLINFCPLCGAKIIKNRLTFKNLWDDISEQFLNIDNRFLKTFIHLFTKPAEVINGFIGGTRKKYVNVIQYFVIALTLLGIQLFLMTTFFKEQLDMSDMFGINEGLDEGMKNFDKGMKSFESLNNGEFFLSSSYQNIVYLFFTPIASLATWLSYYILGKRHYNFTEHIVVNLYYNAQIIIVSAVLNILFLICGFNLFAVLALITILTYMYMFYIFNRVFYERFLETLAAMMLTAVFISIILPLLGVLVALAFLLILKQPYGL